MKIKISAKALLNRPIRKSSAVIRRRQPISLKRINIKHLDGEAIRKEVNKWK